jgi:hypothetical protein
MPTKSSFEAVHLAGFWPFAEVNTVEKSAAHMNWLLLFTGFC